MFTEEERVADALRIIDCAVGKTWHQMRTAITEHLDQCEDAARPLSSEIFLWGIIRVQCSVYLDPSLPKRDALRGSARPAHEVKR